MLDIFDLKSASPMLLEQVKKPFNNKNYIYELKLDGIRCLAYLDKNKTILYNRHGKEITYTYPELSSIHKQVKEKCILDGELVVLNNDGSPNFFALQKRSLLNDKFKIEIESEKTKVNFVAYDIIYFKNKEITGLSLMNRKNILEKNIKENFLLSISRYVDYYGIKLFDLTKKLNLEGIVAKRKESTYQMGKRSDDWIKIKNFIDEDLIIAGLILNEEKQIKDLILCQKIDKKLKYRGKVFLNLSKNEQQKILEYADKNISNPLFKNINNKNIVWIKPKLVCTIQYMTLTKDGQMRQPVFKEIKNI